jgi:hypothetical protein
MSVSPASGRRTLFNTLIALAALGATGSQGSVARSIGIDLDVTKEHMIVSAPGTNGISGTTGIQARNLISAPGWSGMIPAGSAAPSQTPTTTTPT